MLVTSFIGFHGTVRASTGPETVLPTGRVRNGITCTAVPLTVTVAVVALRVATNSGPTTRPGGGGAAPHPGCLQGVVGGVAAGQLAQSPGGGLHADQQRRQHDRRVADHLHRRGAPIRAAAPESSQQGDHVVSP
jgi:hypothetical protein